MTARAYYNERDPSAAQWLRNLIAAGHIAPGEVDERSITEITPDDLRGYAQCHFFAGIGVWSHALRRAGWADDLPVWTGSCPCQPFSAAGKQKRFDDDRHLWPVWFDLIRECRPAIVLGEQVASALDWLDLVSADLEGAGYAFGASDLCAAGFGGAHIRQRLYFVAHSFGEGRRQAGRYLAGHLEAHGAGPRDRACDAGPDDRLADAAMRGCEPCSRDGGVCASDPSEEEPARQCGAPLATGGLADAGGEGWGQERPDARGGGTGGCAQGLDERPGDGGAEHRPHAPLLGRNPADWLFCRDGKWRPVEPGTFPLADAAPQRVGRLRAYGNALDAETAAQFVGAVAETLHANLSEAA